MTAASLFCVATVLFLIPRDLFYSDARFVEVWLGFELHGAAARTTAPLHWAIFALGAYGFWRPWPWIARAAAGYGFYVAVSHLVWSEVSPNGHGWIAGLAQALLFSAIAGLFLYGDRADRAKRATVT